MNTMSGTKSAIEIVVGNAKPSLIRCQKQPNFMPRKAADWQIKPNEDLSRLNYVRNMGAR